jgi:hypothetical protein
MRLHWARVDAIDPKPTLTKGEVEGVELGGAPISVCVCSMTASRRKPTFLRKSGLNPAEPLGINQIAALTATGI